LFHLSVELLSLLWLSSAQPNGKKKNLFDKTAFKNHATGILHTQIKVCPKKSADDCIKERPKLISAVDPRNGQTLQLSVSQKIMLRNCAVTISSENGHIIQDAVSFMFLVLLRCTEPNV
jgi:hypothetical protein